MVMTVLLDPPPLPRSFFRSELFGGAGLDFDMDRVECVHFDSVQRCVVVDNLACILRRIEGNARYRHWSDYFEPGIAGMLGYCL